MSGVYSAVSEVRSVLNLKDLDLEGIWLEGRCWGSRCAKWWTGIVVIKYYVVHRSTCALQYLWFWCIIDLIEYVMKYWKRWRCNNSRFEHYIRYLRSMQAAIKYLQLILAAGTLFLKWMLLHLMNSYGQQIRLTGFILIITLMNSFDSKTNMSDRLLNVIHIIKLYRRTMRFTTSIQMSL